MLFCYIVCESRQTLLGYIHIIGRFIHKKLASHLIENFTWIKDQVGVEAALYAPHKFEMRFFHDDIQIGFLYQADAMFATDCASEFFAHLKDFSNGFW